MLGPPPEWARDESQAFEQPGDLNINPADGWSAACFDSPFELRAGFPPPMAQAGSPPVPCD